MVNRLSEEKKETRRQEAIRLARSGMARRDIATKLQASSLIIKRVLDEAGIPPQSRGMTARKAKEQSERYKVSSVWGISDGDTFKRVTTTKAANAARAQLKALGAL